MNQRTILSAVCLLVACKSSSVPPDAAPDASESAAPVVQGVATAEGSATPMPDSSAAKRDAGGADAGASDAGARGDAGGTDAGSDASAPVADNKVKPPLESADLTDRAKGLFDAIVRSDPAPAEPFWFPKEPFIPLKDVKDPAKYWTNLHLAYIADIKQLHKKRKSWDGAKFVGFKIVAPPKWVPPKGEANKIGYYRTQHARLNYEVGGKPAFIDVHTIISWQGRWYVTHLNKPKK